MDIQYQEFNEYADKYQFRSPEAFKRFSKRFWSLYHYKQTYLFSNPDGFASSFVQPSGVVGQGALLGFLHPRPFIGPFSCSLLSPIHPVVFGQGALVCYQCDQYCNYLFPDGRCKNCTRLTPEEVQCFSAEELTACNFWDGECSCVVCGDWS